MEIDLGLVRIECKIPDRASGISSKIVMPSYTISAKINAVRNYGAEILLHGDIVTVISKF